MDETGISTVPNKVPKVCTAKGKRTVGKVTPGERGQLVTAICCVSASGACVPPTLIFPRKKMNTVLHDAAPHGTLPFISGSGFITASYLCSGYSTTCVM